MLGLDARISSVGALNGFLVRRERPLNAFGQGFRYPGDFGEFFRRGRLNFPSSAEAPQ